MIFLKYRYCSVRLKKEMILRVNQVAAEFRKVSNKQMAETTKRTIRENVSINAQLAKMSDKTMELIQENDELRQKEKNERQHIELLETNEKELLKKNHSNQKVWWWLSPAVVVVVLKSVPYFDPKYVSLLHNFCLEWLILHIFSYI